MPNGYKLYGYGERLPFVSFQRDLLRQHDITSDQSFARNKTQPRKRPSARVDLVDIHPRAVTDAITFAALMANNIKIPIGLILRQLIRRPPPALLERSLLPAPRLSR